MSKYILSLKDVPYYYSDKDAGEIVFSITDQEKPDPRTMKPFTKYLVKKRYSSKKEETSALKEALAEMNQIINGNVAQSAEQRSDIAKVDGSSPSVPTR